MIGLAGPLAGHSFASTMLTMSISWSPFRSGDRSFGSWVANFNCSFKSDHCLIEIPGVSVLEDDLIIFHSTDY
jgi:hypothetical protein